MRLESKTLTLTLLSAAALQLGVSGTLLAQTPRRERHTGSDFPAAQRPAAADPATATPANANAAMQFRKRPTPFRPEPRFCCSCAVP